MARARQILLLTALVGWTCVSAATREAIAQTMPDPDRVAVVAHRGFSAEAPENTLAAVRLAWTSGADAVEIDVYLSADGYPVVIHDPTTSRTTGFDGAVAEMTLAELRELDAGSWRGEPWAGERIPTLREVAATVPAGRRLVVEIKSDARTVVPVAAVMSEALAEGTEWSLISFHSSVCEAAQAAGCETFLLVGSPREAGERAEHLAAAVDFARNAGLAGLDLDRTLIDAALVERLTDAGLCTWAWTVNEPDEARRLREAGVQAITTDRPVAIREALGGAI